MRLGHFAEQMAGGGLRHLLIDRCSLLRPDKRPGWRHLWPLAQPIARQLLRLCAIDTETNSQWLSTLHSASQCNPRAAFPAVWRVAGSIAELPSAGRFLPANRLHHRSHASTLSPRRVGLPCDEAWGEPHHVLRRCVFPPANCATVWPGKAQLVCICFSFVRHSLYCSNGQREQGVSDA